MYYLNLDDNGYLLSVNSTGEGVPIESIDGYDFSGNRINAYRWNGKRLVVDVERLAELEAEEAEWTKEEEIELLTSQLRNTDSIVLEALECLMSATTATGFITALVKAAKSIKDTLAERSELRERIRGLM